MFKSVSNPPLIVALLCSVWWTGSVIADPAELSRELLPHELHTVQLFEAASPAIVNVDVTRVVQSWSRRSVEVPAGSGSGFLWDDRGHVVTNYHVVRNADGARVTLDDQTQLDAELVGVSPDHDLAVLRIDLAQLARAGGAAGASGQADEAGDAADAGRRLPGLPIGRSARLRVGQSVYAIGNPFGLDHTLTTGVVSALDREIPSLTGRTLDGVVQTDAAINPGNSGGPLLDSSGRVIGVNTMIFSPSGASAGVGFAIPIDTVRRVVPQLIETGRYQRPTLGIRIDDRVAAPLLEQLGRRGVLVLAVQPDGPAADAGLRPTLRRSDGRISPGDVITRLDAAPTTSTDELLNALERRAVGDTVTLGIWRQSEQQQIEVQVTLK